MQQFFDGLVEVAVRADEQRSLTRDTTEEEMQRIATRAEEAAAAAAAGEFGFTGGGRGGKPCRARVA